MCASSAVSCWRLWCFFLAELILRVWANFVGSGIVHMVGGVAAAAGAAVVGPRHGRWESPEESAPHNPALCVLLGTLVLRLGWYGFNGASTLALASSRDAFSAALVGMNTTLAPTVAGLVVFLLRSYVFAPKCFDVMAIFDSVRTVLWTVVVILFLNYVFGDFDVLLLTSSLYPVVVLWGRSGAGILNNGDGSIAGPGYNDFAGSGIVHMVQLPKGLMDSAHTVLWTVVVVVVVVVVSPSAVGVDTWEQAGP